MPRKIVFRLPMIALAGAMLLLCVQNASASAAKPAAIEVVGETPASKEKEPPASERNDGQPEAQPDAEKPEPAARAVEEQKDTPNDSTPDAAEPTAERTDETKAEPERAINPRLELWIPSVKRLIDEVHRSNTSPFVEPIRHMLTKSGEGAVDGRVAGGVTALVNEIQQWPDATLVAVTYAPDLDGRSRWVVRLGWPLPELHKRVAALLDLDAAEDVLEGISMRSISPTHRHSPARGAESSSTGSPASQGANKNDSDGYEVYLPETPLFYLLPAGNERSYIASDPSLNVPTGLLGGILDDDDSQSGWLVTARLNFAQTEADSGGTWLSSFSAVTALDYVGAVNESGVWTETLQLHWPAISGMGARAVFNRIDQTFYVPDTSFGAAVLNAPIVSGMLDGMAGLGPQVMMDAPGRVEVVGEPTPGPISLHSDSDVCFTMLPGTGFLPFPDVVVQVRVRRPQSLVEALNTEVKRINKLYAERDLTEPWQHARIRDRDVFWSEPSGASRGLMMPFVTRPVLFTTTERDARDRERNFLVLGLTSTRPEDLVQRWLNFPRTMNFHHFPSERRTNGQIWMNWKELYTWISPYLNIGLASAGGDVLLPSTDQVENHLVDGMITAEVKYAGMTATHRGPVPGGALALPYMISSSLEPDRRGGSDLARERLARQRLRLLHHHCELFKKDIGRWPAEIGELDGYVDFAGHPELLHLRVSPKKAWGELISGMFERKKSDAKTLDDENLDENPAFQTDLYVIDWGRDQWTLGFKPGTFEHLEKLYIDHEGEIYRILSPTTSVSNEADDNKSKESKQTDDHADSQSGEVNGKE